MFMSCLLATASAAYGQDAGAALAGVADVEEMNEETVEKYSYLERHPLRVNYASEQKLAASGLMSRYQAASLADYRRLHGDILSVAELAAVDGFGTAVAESMRPFLSFESLRLPGQAEKQKKLGHDLELRTACKFPGFTAAGRCKAEYGESLEAAVSYRDRLNGYLSICGKRRPWRIIAGSYNARFGQGLTLWSGMSIGGITTPEAAYKRSSGVSPTWTYSGTGLKGLAASMGIGKIRLSAFGAKDIAGGHLTWLRHDGEAGITFKASPAAQPGESACKLAGDFKLCVRGIDAFGEASWDFSGGCLAALVGAAFPVGEKCRGAMVIRHYPASFDPAGAGAMRSSTKVTDETGILATVRHGPLLFSADAVVRPESGKRQLKLLLQHEWKVSGSITLKTRAAERLRDYDRRTRTDLRADLAVAGDPLSFNVRMNVLQCRKTGASCYAEAGYRKEKGALWLRATAFHVDNWDDRIYVYERDAPGNFSVPACYGRGFGLSAYASAKFGRLRLYLKGGFTARKEKPDRAELKFQLDHAF